MAGSSEADRSAGTTPQSRIIPPTKQRLVLLVGVAFAFGALVLAVIYQGDTGISEPVLSGSAADGGGARPNDANAEAQPLNIDPIQEWLPRSGVGSTCTEPVGVDLIPGFAAVLTINGQQIAEEDMNGAVDSTGAIPAGRSLGQYTYGPEEDCPNGALLRPENNSIEACIYRIEETPASCRRYPPFTFDAL